MINNYVIVIFFWWGGGGAQFKLVEIKAITV